MTYFVLKALLSLPHNRSKCFGYAIASGEDTAILPATSIAPKTGMNICGEVAWLAREVILEYPLLVST